MNVRINRNTPNSAQRKVLKQEVTKEFTKMLKDDGINVDELLS